MIFKSVPPVFMPKMPVRYPPHQDGPMIEDRAAEYFAENDIPGWTYLPIRWTAFHVKNGYGKKVDLLRAYVKTLPDDNYFTVVQYDDGTLCDDLLPGARIFGAGGVGTDPIPLLCSEHPVRSVRKDLLFSFVGSFSTHPIRKEIQKLDIVPNTWIGTGSTEIFREMTYRSQFALCPRGYGKSSFRLYEVMQMGTVPVYISDEFWLPWEKKLDWGKVCVMLRPGDIMSIPAILKNTQFEGVASPEHIYRTFFSMRRTLDLIKLEMGRASRG